MSRVSLHDCITSEVQRECKAFAALAMRVLRNPTDFCMDLITPGMKGAREDEFVRPLCLCVYVLDRESNAVNSCV